MTMARPSRALPAGLLLLAAPLLGGCASSDRSAGPSAAPAEAARIEFRSYNFPLDAKGKSVVAAQVRVRAAAGGRARDYYVKVGDAIGRAEPDGDYRTGLTVAKIDKGQRPLRTRLGGEEVTVLVESYYLTARDASGREQVVWLSEGRSGAPAATPR
jgi:hypothetical protein